MRANDLLGIIISRAYNLAMLELLVAQMSDERSTL